MLGQPTIRSMHVFVNSKEVNLFTFNHVELHR